MKFGSIFLPDFPSSTPKCESVRPEVFNQSFVSVSVCVCVISLIIRGRKKLVGPTSVKEFRLLNETYLF